MGGAGAKERRRLQRLEKSGSLETKLPQKWAVQATTSRAPADKHRSNKPPRYQSKPTASHATKANWKKTHIPQSPPLREKKKFKKPKHLKRKLESTEDDHDREAILRKLNAFESRKRSNTNGKRSANGETAKSLSSHIATDFPRASFRRDRVAVPPTNDIPKSKTVVETVTNSNDSVAAEKTNNNTSSSVCRTTVTRKPNNKSEDVDSRHLLKDTTLATKETAAKDKASLDSSGSSEHQDDGRDSDNDDSNENSIKRQRGKRRRGRKDTSIVVEEAQPEPEPPQTQPVVDRYCIGRKPVTDFAIGTSYPANVVYAKYFGVFFDIGCHSDAFCHVSRLSDEFVEDPVAAFPEGKQVNARVVEIDRRHKRITVSLQSKARLNDEKASMQAREARKAKQRPKKRQGQSNPGDGATENRNETGDSAKSEGIHATSNHDTTVPDPATMTQAELKRARKLARRAERRAKAQPQEAQ